ncbi:MAG: hypothetical protein HC815_16785 [Richelia sp. RM1_1_1]|nr:hypothetical protein [Richelia sp. RM1_1_1]
MIQREGLLKYLLNRPYREVAGAVEVLAKAPKTEINLEVPDEQSENIVAQDESEANTDTPKGTKSEVVTSSTEELSVFSHA